MRKSALFVLISLLVVSLRAAQSATDGPAPSKAKSEAGYEVETVPDLAYYDGADADPVKHKLDLYLPKGKKDFPVLLFVHGGAWRHGDRKTWFDIYGNIGRTFARHGIGTVVTSYRLSPQVQHPKHAEDVAKAVAWTVRHLGKYGGRVDQLFLSGHSAGAHLVSLLATDPAYLKAEGLTIRTIKGVIPISGVYTIPPGRLFSTVFGEDEESRRKASPITHVNGNHPPFLILYADGDFPSCDKMSDGLCKALKKCNCETHMLEIKQRDHISIIVMLANADDPATTAMFQFIDRHAGTKVPGQSSPPGSQP